MAKKIVRTLSVEIAKPMEPMTWDQLGTLLRTQRKIIPQLLRAGMDARIACGFVQNDTTTYARNLIDTSFDTEQIIESVLGEVKEQYANPEESAEARRARVKKIVDGLKYKVVSAYATQSSAAAAKNARDHKTKGMSIDSVVYETIRQELEIIRKGKWPEACRPALDMCGGMLSALAQRVSQSFEKRPSFNGDGQPIPIPAALSDVRLDEKSIIVRVKLVGDGSVDLIVAPFKGQHWRLLREIAEKKIKHGDMKIVYVEDRRKKKKKWFLKIAYEAPVSQAKDVSPERAMIVHRGIRNALSLMATTGFYGYESGAKMFHQLGVLDKRMENTRKISQETLGSGAKGHGKKRRQQSYEAFGNKRADVVKTWCQQMGAFVCRKATEHGCGKVVIEEYGGIKPHKDSDVRRALLRFPMYQLKQSIKDACEVRGLIFEEVPAEYVSTTCPVCGSNDSRQHNTHTGTFHCRTECGFERPADFVAALNMLRRSGVDATEWDDRMARAAKANKDVEKELLDDN